MRFVKCSCVCTCLCVYSVYGMLEYVIPKCIKNVMNIS